MSGFRLIFVVFSINLYAQEQAMSPKEFEHLVGGANGVFQLAWPFIVQQMDGQLQQSFSEMNDGSTVRKLKITDMNLKQAPSMEVLPCDGKGQCRRVRFSLPGKGKWSIKVEGEMIPPWQRNADKWRKLKLTLKDVSLVQDFEVDLSQSKLAFVPVGPPKLTYRLTSPNLLYKAVLATAQKLMKSSLETMLEEQFMEGLPIAEVALSDLKGFNFNSAMSQLGERLGPEPDLFSDSQSGDHSEQIAFIPLNEAPSREVPVQTYEHDAFAVSFMEKELDFFAPSFVAEVDIKVPPGQKIKEVSFKLGDQEIANLSKPPWRIEVEPGDDAQVLLATATLSDGIEEDDYLYIEGRGHIEEMEVQYTNLYVNFPDKNFDQKELERMRPEHFKVTENGIVQEISNMEIALDRPLALSVVMDNSGSMDGERIKQARLAAGKFVEKVVRPGDAMLLVAYNDKVIASKITYEKKQMLRGIKGLTNMRGATRTYDALAKAMDLTSHLDALRVVLLITDGHNYGSKIKFNQIQRRLEKENVLVYAIGIDVRRNSKVTQLASLRGARGMLSASRPSLIHLRHLYDIAAITGGRTLFVDKPKLLIDAFSAIERELRSQIHLGYYSNLSTAGKGWRAIKVSYLPEQTPIHHKEGYWKE